MAVRVTDGGGSEGRAVIARIGVATSPHAQAGRLPPRSLGTREFGQPAAEAKQMTAIPIAPATRRAGAASHDAIDWHAIDWRAVNRTVRRLQARIVQATQEGRWGKVKAL